MKNILALFAFYTLAILPSAQAQAQPVSDNVVKIGVLADMSGVYKDMSGPGAIEAAKIAVEEFGGSVLGKPIEIISADHQNKPDIAASLARRWYDVEQVDAIADVVGSANSLAVSGVAADRKRIALISNGATAELNGARCNAYTVQWRSDTYAMARATAKGILATGGDSWFIIGADYALGHSITKDLTEVVKAHGGKVVGSVFHPLGASDFSSFIVQAQGSGAKVIAFANAGADFIGSIKTANEFGLGAGGKQRLTGVLVFITDVHAIGLATIQGLSLESDFYWDLDARTRSFADRFFKRTGKMPAMTQAGTYSAVLTYLKAIQAAGTDSADPVMAELKKMKIDDAYARNAFVRADGLLIHDLYLFKVKAPAQSKGPWDYYEKLATIPAGDAFRPLADSACPLAKQN